MDGILQDSKAKPFTGCRGRRHVISAGHAHCQCSGGDTLRHIQWHAVTSGKLSHPLAGHHAESFGGTSDPSGLLRFGESHDLSVYGMIGTVTDALTVARDVFGFVPFQWS